jgi:hypothetical protein
MAAQMLTIHAANSNARIEMKLCDALAQVRAQDACLEEVGATADQFAIEDGAVRVGERRFILDSRAIEQLCDWFPRRPKAPAAYLASLPSSLCEHVLRVHLCEGFDAGAPVRVFVRDSDLVGIGRADLALLTGSDVLESAFEGVQGRHDDVDISAQPIENNVLRFVMVTYSAETEVRPGDVVRAGIEVTHSLIGDQATKVEGYAHRLICANGAIDRQCFEARRNKRTRRLSSDAPVAREQQKEQIRRLSAEALSRVTQRLGGLRRLTTERADFEHLTSNWLRRSRLSAATLIPRLRRAHAEEGGDQTTYGVMNAFTRVATHDTDLSSNVRAVLARMGGMLGLGHDRLCPRCWSLIAATNN